MTRRVIDKSVGHVDGRAQWLAWRARNAIKRVAIIGTVAAGVFITALLTLALVPRRANRAAEALAPLPNERVDTARYVARLVDTRRLIASEDSTLVRERVIAAPKAPPPDTFPAYLVARRDSLRGLSGELARLIARAENAPLPSSYRSLADAQPLRGDPTVAALVDTLTLIEREREDFGIAGGADPVFVALTARVTAIGRSIQDVARGRRSEIRRQIAAISPPPVDPLSMSPLLAADTLARRAHLDSLRRTLLATQHTLAAARVKNADVERRAERARELANVAAPPAAMLAAALALGLAAGFGAAVAAEVRQPRLADASEAERAAGVRVLSIVQPRSLLPERTRRRVDVDAPPLIDRTSEAYRLLYLHFAATGSALPLLTVTGDEPAVAATVATNLAAASAAEARSTLLVDADFGAAAVAGVLRVPFEPGLADVIRGSHDWAEALQTATVGRDGTLEVMASGVWRGEPPSAAAAEVVRRDLARVARRYDLTVLVAPEGHVAHAGTSLLPAPDVILCARLGATSVRALRAEADALRNAGVRLRGIVLWAAEPPQVLTAAELSGRRRVAVRTAERREPQPAAT